MVSGRILVQQAMIPPGTLCVFNVVADHVRVISIPNVGLSGLETHHVLREVAPPRRFPCKRAPCHQTRASASWASRISGIGVSALWVIQYTAPPGSSNASDCKLVCPAGTTGQPGNCSACAVDLYKAEAGNHSCKPCSANAVPAAENTACQCLPGYMVNYSTGHYPSADMLGLFEDLSTAHCQACTPGYYTSVVSGWQQCVACDAATYNPLPAQTNVSACLVCPYGTNSYLASQHLSACQPVCDTGLTGPFDACTTCATNTFKSRIGPSARTACGEHGQILACHLCQFRRGLCELSKW